MFRVCKYIPVFLLVFAMIGAAQADFFAAEDRLHRKYLAGSEECRRFNEQPQLLYDANNQELSVGEAQHGILGCSFQRQEGPRPKTAFTLAFLEFHDNGNLRDDGQLTQINDYLKSGGPHVVVVFVHGWRHDAAIGDTDVAKFRTLLALMRQSMNQRCNETRGPADNGYCNHSLTGIFVGWPGRARWDGEGLLGNIMATLPIRSRKAVSDDIAGPVTKKLLNISELLKGNHRHSASNKLLVIGHSFGGNILASGLKHKFVQAAKEHTAGDILRSVLGDLVVLINPASSADNWLDIQRALRKKWGVADSQTPFGEVEDAIGIHKFFPDAQRPVYLAISSTCRYPPFVPETSRRYLLWVQYGIPCDKPVAKLFPVLSFTNRKRQRENLTAIGHFEPDGFCARDLRGCPSKPPEQPAYLGVTHELDVNCLGGDQRACQTETSYRNVMDGLAGGGRGALSCDQSDGWLAKARDNARPASPNSVLWDAGWSKQNAVHPLDSRRGLYAQFRHSIYRGLGKFYITPANDPFWNVRAHHSAIKGHSLYSGFPMACLLSQLLLDNPVSR